MYLEDYVRNVMVMKVIDGDTIEVDIDLGFSMWLHEQRVRVLGVDTPEIKGPTRDAGIRARKFTEDWLRGANGVVVKTHLAREEDNFGRVLAEVWVGGESLAAALIASGNAVERPGEAEQYGAVASVRGG